MLHVKKQIGFTLIEMMMVVALIAIVAAFAVPSFSRIVASNQVTSTANGLVGFLGYAKAEAVKRGRTVNIRPVDGASFNSGALAWLDSNGNGSLDADEELRRQVVDSGQVTLPSTVTSFGFRSNGYLTPAAAAEVGIGVCADAIDQGIDVFIGFSGRVRTAERAC